MEELAFPAKWDPEGVAMEDGQFAGAQQGTDITGLYPVTDSILKNHACTPGNC